MLKISFSRVARITGVDHLTWLILNSLCFYLDEEWHDKRLIEVSVIQRIHSLTTIASVLQEYNLFAFTIIELSCIYKQTSAWELLPLSDSYFMNIASVQ
jgi:hypothetical protein